MIFIEMTQTISSSTSLTLMVCWEACTKIQACQPFWCEVYC